MVDILAHFWKKWKKIQNKVIGPENVIFGKGSRQKKSSPNGIKASEKHLDEVRQGTSKWKFNVRKHCTF